MPDQDAATPKNAAAGLSVARRQSLTIRRRRCGRGFAYYKDGRRIRDANMLRRLASLAVPPAYENVFYAADPSAHLQAVGSDAAGRLQYRYHAEWEKVRERRKARHLVRLLQALPRIRRHVAKVLASRDPTREFAMAAAIALVDATGLRSGTARHARLSGARGAVSLLKSNVEISGRSVTLTFRAKGGKQVVKDVSAPRLTAAIRVLRRVPGPRLFLYRDGGQIRAVRVRDVNVFLRDVAGCNVCLKDFRTLRASMHVVQALMRIERGTNQAKRKRQVKQAVERAADDLANTVTVCRKSYVHDGIMEAFERGRLLNGKPGSGRPSPARKVLSQIVNGHSA